MGLTFLFTPRILRIFLGNETERASDAVTTIKAMSWTAARFSEPLLNHGCNLSGTRGWNGRFFTKPELATFDRQIEEV